MRLSRRTLASLARVIDEVYTHTEIDTLAYEMNREPAAVRPNKLAKARGLVEALERDAESKNQDGELVDLIFRVLDAAGEWSRTNKEVVAGLEASASIDGFAFTESGLVPNTVEPAQLAPQITLLEISLQEFGLAVAQRHYEQSTDSLARGAFEAANGQLRSFLEDLFVTFGELRTKKSFSEPSAALQHLRDLGVLDNAEWSMCRALWTMCQTNGPHRGLTSEQEAIFRLQISTAVARFLLAKLR